MNGLLTDSIAVVAFYCPDIDVPSGPSIFGGRSGMILGLSIPGEHLHIFASQVTLKPVSRQPIIVPVGIEPISHREFERAMEYMLGSELGESRWQ